MLGLVCRTTVMPDAIEDCWVKNIWLLLCLGCQHFSCDSFKSLICEDRIKIPIS
jgi:hypothetical protein